MVGWPYLALFLRNRWQLGVYMLSQDLNTRANNSNRSYPQFKKTWLRWGVCVPLALVASPAVAGEVPRCGPRAEMAAVIESEFKEQRTVLMIDARGRLVEIFRNANTGAWTALLTPPGLPACISMTGTHYAGYRDKPEGAGS